MGQRITDKKLKDKRFAGKEKVILTAFFSVKEKISTNCLAKRAKVSRATINRHHGNAYDIVSNYEKYILKKYKMYMRCPLKKCKVMPRKIYLSMLVFMYKNRIVLGMLIKNKDKEILEEMVEFLESMVINNKEKHSNEVLRVYLKEITGILEIWVLDGFKKEKIDEILKKIMYLTDNLEKRLAPLEKK